MRFATTHRYWLAAALSAGFTLAGCGWGGGGAAPSSSPTLTSAQIQTVVNEMVQCIRSNGAPGMPDVKVENGRAVIPDVSTLDDTTRRNLNSATQACKSIQDQVPPSVFEEPDDTEQRKPTSEDVPALRAWATCIREHGVPEWPDPKPDGSFPKGNSAIKEGKSARVVAAWQACERYWNGGIERT